MSDKYGECYCGDCISFNKCKSDKGTRINLVSEGCSCFEPNDIAKIDYPILPKWLAEHDKQVRAEAIEECIKHIKLYKYNAGTYVVYDEILDEIAEQLKGAEE